MYQNDWVYQKIFSHWIRGFWGSLLCLMFDNHHTMHFVAVSQVLIIQAVNATLCLRRISGTKHTHTHTQLRFLQLLPGGYQQCSDMESVCTCLQQVLWTQLGNPFSFSSCPSLRLPTASPPASLPFSPPHQEMSTTTPQRKSILSVLLGEGGTFRQMSRRLPLTHSTP